MKRRMKDWLTILVFLLDDIAALGIILLILHFFDIDIPISVAIAIGIAFGGFIFLFHKKAIPALRRKKITGSEGMIGLTCTVVESLKPSGMVKVGDEYWKATAIDEHVETGKQVEIIQVIGLKLKVKCITVTEQT